jgi:hypothetical protein
MKEHRNEDGRKRAEYEGWKMKVDGCRRKMKDEA